jgi:hypothetical protein
MQTDCVTEETYDYVRTKLTNEIKKNKKIMNVF